MKMGIKVILLRMMKKGTSIDNKETYDVDEELEEEYRTSNYEEETYDVDEPLDDEYGSNNDAKESLRRCQSQLF